MAFTKKYSQKAHKNLFNAPSPEGETGAKKKKGTPNRYGVKYTDEAMQARFYNGIQFDSLREMERYKALLWREKAGEISDIQRQVRYKFVHNDVLIGAYVADFVYLESGQTVIEDSKGAKTAEYKLKKKMMMAFHGITIRET
jgi:hypothetical protein